MRIEVNNERTFNNLRPQEKKMKEMDVFEILFKQNLIQEKENHPKLLNEKDTVLSIPIQKFLELEENISDPDIKEQMIKMFMDLVNEKKLTLETSKSLFVSKDISDLQKQTLNSSEINVQLSVKELKRLILVLEKISDQKLDLTPFKSLLQNNKEPVNSEMKQPLELNSSKQLSNRETKKQNFETRLITNDENKHSDDISLQESRNIKETKDETSDVKDRKTKPMSMLQIREEKYFSEEDIFEELKKLRFEEQSINSKEINHFQHHNSDWQVTSVKKTQMKLEDWIETFKQEIDKLTDFRIESREKVSLMLKEQDERIRIIVEKRENYILVEVDVTEKMREKVNHILTEVRSEMKDKGVEVKVELKQEQDQDERNSKENNDKKDKYQGGGQNARKHNK